MNKNQKTEASNLDHDLDALKKKYGITACIFAVKSDKGHGHVFMQGNGTDLTDLAKNVVKTICEEAGPIASMTLGLAVIGADSSEHQPKKTKKTRK